MFSRKKKAPVQLVEPSKESMMEMTSIDHPMASEIHEVLSFNSPPGLCKGDRLSEEEIVALMKTL
jgi:hypothetical protein